MRSQYFILLFNRISWLCGPQPRGDEASNGGCNSGSIGHDFLDNFNFLIFTMRTEPFSKCEKRSSFQIGCQVRTWAVLTSSENLQSGYHNGFSLAGSHWELDWKLAPVFSWRVRTAQNWCEWTPQIRSNCASKLQDLVNFFQNLVTIKLNIFSQFQNKFGNWGKKFAKEKKPPPPRRNQVFYRLYF
jgi:hypothetical protein